MEKDELVAEEPIANVEPITDVEPITNVETMVETIVVENTDGLSFLQTVGANSIDLVLTDPPYIISKETGMNKHYNNVKSNEKKGILSVKDEQQWEKYKTAHTEEFTELQKNNYLKYGTIYGSKYCVQTDYGDWDKNFTVESLDEFIKEYYRVLKPGGTVIIFFDIWKIGLLKDLLEKNKFKQIRFIEWIKTNPQPLNSKTNYLTNCREIALLGVKGAKPTFHSKYDNGIYDNIEDDDDDNDDDNNGMVYYFPIQGGKQRFHPTQKSVELFKELIKKHSNENDTILDTFLGGGTTAFACCETGRHFKGCEINKEYYDKTCGFLKTKSKS